ncbi:MAG: DUF6114 domain-containing protein [Candidatus Thermoplasmatota archaeon]|nr:DUF6114 domain-containing protein [Candidatus Thermoplasmatota archaeon]
MSRFSFKDSPIDSGIVSLLGSLLILYVGVRSIIISGTLTGITSAEHIALFLGAVWGSVLTASSIIVMFGTRWTRIFGVIIVVFSLLSWIGTEGGFTIGFVLCFLGGLMAASWKKNRVRASLPNNPV